MRVGWVEGWVAGGSVMLADSFVARRDEKE